MAKSFAHMLNDARLLASGIRKNKQLLEKRGIGEQRAEEIDTLAGEAELLDNEQESLKARLKMTGEELLRKKEELNAAVSTDIRIIKADIPQALWKEFGIQAKK